MSYFSEELANDVLWFLEKIKMAWKTRKFDYKVFALPMRPFFGKNVWSEMKTQPKMAAVDKELGKCRTLKRQHPTLGTIQWNQVADSH